MKPQASDGPGDTSPMQWLNGSLGRDAARRADPVAYHMPTTVIVAGPAGESLLDRVEAELLPFSTEVYLTPGEGVWTSELLGDWIERCDLSHQAIHVDAALIALVPAPLRARAALSRAPLDRPTSPRTHCTSPTLEIRLLPDGVLMPCRSEQLDRSAALGSVVDGPLESLWNERSLRNLRAGLAQEDLPNHCRRCPHAGANADQGAGDEPLPSDVLSHFGDQDLSPLRQPVEPSGFLRQANAIGLAASYRNRTRDLESATDRLESTLDQMSDVRQHASNLERRLGGILGSWPYRLARPITRAIWPKGPLRKRRAESRS